VRKTAFRRYLLRTVKLAALRFFTRQGHNGIRPPSDLEALPFDKYCAGASSRITHNELKTNSSQDSVP
jgi:hypothetical protein